MKTEQTRNAICQPLPRGCSDAEEASIPLPCPLRMSTGDPSSGEGLVVPATVRPQGFLVGLSGPATPHEGLGKHPWKLGPHLPSTSLALKLCV